MVQGNRTSGQGVNKEKEDKEWSVTKEKKSKLLVVTAAAELALPLPDY